MNIYHNFQQFLSDKNVLIAIGILFLIFAVSLIIYLLPSLIAQWRHKKQKLAITLLNIFGGWTIIVWLGCLVWASFKEDSDGNE